MQLLHDHLQCMLQFSSYIPDYTTTPATSQEHVHTCLPYLNALGGFPTAQGTSGPSELLLRNMCVCSFISHSWNSRISLS